MADSEVRKRSNVKSKEASSDSDSDTAGKPVPASVIRKEDNERISKLDILRSLVFVLLVSSAVSYFVTRESFVWNVERPVWSRPEAIKAWIQGPKQYTEDALAAYDGTDPDLPILLALNGTVYDVSKGRRHYGPGGGYQYFSGADASRSFITGCFKEDRTGDLRGVELAFLPRDNPEVDALYTQAELEKLKEEEVKLAKKQAYDALKHWVDFFEQSPKYPKVGTLKREPGWDTKGPVPTLCKHAEESRPSSRAKPSGT
ncbi:putative membrane steroid-binding protein 2 [Venustampulla echinocandica]|uniref:Putative membrane steroid-binding protein 2 n=1 Tax=Venustampulla echinocandica TaxID=2656787 RepID=A0A370TJC0_9HELO|nr:putative membrane steroid-binding protein 2 [Venustampulla echinocandica]RDL35446.1 putative membrane steroid-binding protein 2 [Venustampulla echinocandica]